MTNNNDSGTDTGTPRSRNSIAKTFLTNTGTEKSNGNSNSTSTNAVKGPPSPDFSKNFEYLIRRELDIEHAPSALHLGTTSSFSYASLETTKKLSFT